MPTPEQIARHITEDLGEYAGLEDNDEFITDGCAQCQEPLDSIDQNGNFDYSEICLVCDQIIHHGCMLSHKQHCQ